MKEWFAILLSLYIITVDFKVVPALREWCEERLIHLIECDLRWGVPKDYSKGG